VVSFLGVQHLMANMSLKRNCCFSLIGDYDGRAIKKSLICIQGACVCYIGGSTSRFREGL
jgi:hypothetical protein